METVSVTRKTWHADDAEEAMEIVNALRLVEGMDTVLVQQNPHGAGLLITVEW